MYCTSAISKGLNCIGKNKNNVQYFKPLKHKKKKQKIKNNKFTSPQRSQVCIIVNKTLIKTGSPIKSWKD